MRSFALLLLLPAALGCTDYYEKRYERAIERMSAEQDVAASLAHGAEACSSVLIGEPRVEMGDAGAYRIEVTVIEPGVHFQTSLESLQRVTLETMAREVLCIFRAAESEGVPVEAVVMARVLVDDSQELYRVSLSRARLEDIDGWEELPGWFGDDDAEASAIADAFDVLAEDWEGLSI